MSVAIPSFSPVDLRNHLQWYEARDTLLGCNYVKQDVKRALELASTCQHPDAQWLTQIFAGKDVSSADEARNIFLAQGNDDARALCFTALIRSDSVDLNLLRRAAEMGFAYAQARLAGFSTADGVERFSLALRSSQQGEREGFLWLGLSYQRGIGCDEDIEKAKSCFHKASLLNQVFARVRFASLLGKLDPQRWHWLGLAAAQGAAFNFVPQVNQFKSDASLAPVVFMIGRALIGHVDPQRGEIFGKSRDFKSRIGPANRAMDFFTFQCDAARKAVDAWCLIARRQNGLVNKDIRKKIGMLVWESRMSVLYK